MDEQARLETLESYAILDTPPEPDFDRLASLAAFICETPMAAITLVDDKRQWFKAMVGLEFRETAKSIAFCAHTIQARQPFIVTDAAGDPRFSDNPLVTAAPKLRAYAGIPLISPDGYPLGTLAVMDLYARQFTEGQLSHLTTLAQQVMLKLDLRRRESMFTRQQQIFHHFADAMPMMVWTADAEGRLDYVNKLFLHYSGLQHSDVVAGQDWAVAVHRDDIDTTLKLWRESLVSGQAFLSEARVRRYDSSYRWHAFRAVPVRDDDQHITRWYGTAIDIHDRNLSEAKAQRLADRLAIILESITDAFMTIDRNWQFTFINKEAERLLQRSRVDLDGKNIWQEFPEALGTDFETFYSQAMTEGSKGSFEAFFAPLDTWFSVNVYPSTEGLAIYFQDINARRKSQERQKLLETCIEHINDIVIITEAEVYDETGPRIIFVNKAFVSHTGYSREEVLGKTPGFLHGPNTQEDELQRILAAMKQWQPVRAELISYTKTGEEFWLDIDLVPVADSKGWFTHWISVARDMTERKQMELERGRIIELEQAQRLAELANQTKSFFLATMSHEIRTPISGVIGMVEVLQQTSLQNHQQEMVDIIRDSSQSLLGIIDDILDFSKIEAGKMNIESVPLSLFKKIKNVCAVLDYFASSKNVELTFFCDPALPEMVMGDALRLRQVLLNLINNAVKFSSTAQPGRVKVRVQKIADTDDAVTAKFLIIDNGIGMAPETLDRLFQPFAQADVSTTRHFGGTGLGLTISRHLVELMGGTIKATSELSKGATFEFDLTFTRAPTATVSPIILPDLKGLSCVVLGEKDGLGDDIAAYLEAGHVKILRISHQTLVIRARPELDDPRIWIIDAADAELWFAAIPPQIIRSLRWVCIRHGLARKPRLIEKNRVILEGNLLDRYALFKAIAVAAGREANDEWHTDSDSETALPFLSSKIKAARQKQLILVAEDNETNRKVIAHQLGLLGYAADFVGNGQEALEQLQVQHYSLLITDLHMPEMDGYELVQQLRSQCNDQTNSAYLPVIALSANVLRDEAGRCRALGVDEYLTKPASLTKLQQALERWLPGEYSTGIKPTTIVADSPINLAVLKNLVGDEADVVEEFLHSFYRDSLPLADQIRAAAAAEKLSDLIFSAHKLKSSARSVGAQRLGDLCAELEAAAKDAELGLIAERLFNFEQELILVQEYFNNSGGATRE